MGKPVGVLSLLDDESRLPKVNEKKKRFSNSIFNSSRRLFFLSRPMIRRWWKNLIIISVQINTNVIQLIETTNIHLLFIIMPAKFPIVP